MATLEQVMVEMVSRITALEKEVDDLKSQSGETTSVDVVLTFPSEPFDGQIVLLNDGTGANGNGAFYRFDDALNDWNEI